MYRFRIYVAVLVIAYFIAGCAAPVSSPDGGAEGGSEEVASGLPDDPRVAILIVDDFTAPEDDKESIVDLISEYGSLDAFKEIYGKDENGVDAGCLTAPEGSEYISGGGGGGLHGESVWTMAEQEIVDRGLSNIELRAVHIPDFSVATATTAIRAGLESVAAEGITKAVINMSWVILPSDSCVPNSVDDYLEAVCTIVDENTAVNLANLQELKDLLDLKQIDTSGNSTTFGNICGAGDGVFGETDFAIYQFWDVWLTAQIANTLDPNTYQNQLEGGVLLNLLSDCSQYGEEEAECPVEQVISVGAAGNVGWDFSLIPGLWESVVSTSALDGLGDYSNSGEIALDGIHPTMIDLDGDPLKGTSYAAPRLSVLEALHLQLGGGNECDGEQPPLGYDSWDNIPITDVSAIGGKCSTFPVP